MFTFSDFAPLREVLRYWQEEMGVAVLVDWPALSTERLWPQSRIACSAANQPWSEAMDSVLAPLGLGWRAVDHRTLEITTAAKVATEPMLELYRVAEGTVGNGEDLVARVRGLTDRPDANGIVFDAASRVLLVRQPAAVQRKVVRELAGILIAPSAAAR